MLTEDAMNQASSEGDARWRVVTARAIEVVLGVVLLVAGLIKAYEPMDFARQIAEYKLITAPGMINAIVWLLIAVECALGAALIAGWRRRIAVPSATGLFLLFLGMVSWAWATGATQDCGCFGSWVERTPAQAFVEDLLMVAAIVVAWTLHRGEAGRFKLARAFAVALALVLGLTVTAVSSRSARQSSDPVERLQAHSEKGSSFVGLVVEGLEYDIQKGDHLVALIDTGCDHCQESVPELNRLAEKGKDRPQLSALCSNSPYDIELFQEEYDARFPIGRITRDDFMRLFDRGEAPRLILLRDGDIVKVWDGVVPPAEEVIGHLRALAAESPSPDRSSP